MNRLLKLMLFGGLAIVYLAYETADNELETEETAEAFVDAVDF